MCNTIQKEMELAKSKMIEEVTFQGKTLAKLTRDNVAIVEAMIRNDSVYIHSADVSAAPVYNRKGEVKYGGSYHIFMEGMLLDEDGNYAGYDEERTKAWLETRDADPRFKYLNFRECKELRQYSLADACELSASEILDKYLSATLPIYHKAMRSGDHLLMEYRVSDDIPDAYLDQLFAMAWKADLKMWALKWDKEKTENGGTQ